MRIIASDAVPPTGITTDEKTRRGRHQLCTDIADERGKRGGVNDTHSGGTTVDTPARIKRLGAEHDNTVMSPLTTLGLRKSPFWRPTRDNPVPQGDG